MKATFAHSLLPILMVCAQSAESPATGPKGAAVVGTVTSRLGNCVAVALAEGAAVQPNETLLVGRPSLLVALGVEAKLLEAWAGWQPAGRITLRVPRGARHWLAIVADEVPPTKAAGQQAPSIQPGDIVHRGAGAPAPAVKDAAPTPGR
mgnify:CR=1 FL=1